MNTTNHSDLSHPERDSLFVTGGQPPMPAWSPHRGRYGGELRVGFSQKLQREVHLCYELEYFHWLLLECDPQVQWLCEHPLRVKVRLGDRVVTTTFDMWVRYVNGREELHEVKPAARLTSEQARRQIQAQRLWCRTAGIAYQVITEQGLCQQPLLDNCLRLYPYFAQDPGESWKRQVLARVARCGALALRDLRGDSPAETNRLRHAACQLIRRGALVVDLAGTPWDNLILRRPNHETKPTQ